MRTRRTFTTSLLGLVLLWAAGAPAQTAPPTPQFDMLGFIQEATLDTAGAICTPTDPILAGGTMTINGVKMVIPCNTILQMPATSLTWAQLFDPAISAPVGVVIGTAPAAQGAGQTRLALADDPMPFPSFEVHVQGNVVNGQYIVGLIVPVTQQGLNAGSGLISYIDYATGAFRVGGIPNDPNCVTTAVGGGPLCSGALVQINDPVGRYGLAHSPDPRLTSDTSNPTAHASTGIPVCIPRVAPPAIDPLCPVGNRPRNGDTRFPADPFLPLGAPLKIFDMPPPADGVFPDARLQVPMEVGDQVIFAGTLYKLNPLATLPGATAGTTIPDNTAANTYISAHTVEDVLGIFTAPGIPPAYVFVEEVLIGTGGDPVAGLLQEATTRLTVVGFTTDPTRLININAVDVNPCTGAETLRLLATTDPSTQPVRGRFVHRVLGGLFMPPTREYLVTNPTGGGPGPVANGLTAGQYRLPNFEFVFPENHNLGDPLIPNNFQDMPFLAQGSGPLFGAGPVVGQLDPWPGTPAPPKAVCTATGTAPIVSAGADITVLSGTRVTLTGTVQKDPTSAILQTAWTQTGGPGVALASANTLTPSFTAPTVAAGQSVQLEFTLTVTDTNGTGTDAVTVRVTAPTDSVAFAAANWKAVAGGRREGKLTVTATSSDPTVGLTLEEIATDGTVKPLGTLTTTGNPPGTFSFSASGVPQPAKLILHSSGGGSATATCGAPSATGVVTCQ